MFAEVHDTDLISHLVMPEASLLLAFWELARGARQMPTEAQVPRERLMHLIDDIMMLRPDGDDFIYEHYGRRISARSGFDMTGRRVSDFQGDVGTFFMATYRKVLQSQRPLATLHRLGAYGETPLWERVVLPLGDEKGVTLLLVANRVRAIENELSHLVASARGRGVIAIQFIRDADGVAVDGRIIAANPRAREITGRRMDELLGVNMLSVFPGLVEAGVWERYLGVATSREAQTFAVTYDADAVAGTFEVRVVPFHDGVSIAFDARAERASAA
jgi:PAS domain-containing protein